MSDEIYSELWDQRNSEPDRAYTAFQTFLNLPSSTRTLLAAYRNHVNNPQASKPSDTWCKWCKDFTWRERARAYDYHLAILERRAYEQGLWKAAQRQASQDKSNREQTSEILTVCYERAMEWLGRVDSSDLRTQDVWSVIRLHMDYLTTFDVERFPEQVLWTDETDARFAERLAQLDELDTLDDGRGGKPSDQSN